MPPTQRFVDALAVVVDTGAVDTIVTKSTGKELLKRDITLMDREATTLRCTLWASEAENFESSGGVVGCVVAIKMARVSDFNGGSPCRQP